MIASSPHRVAVTGDDEADGLNSANAFSLLPSMMLDPQYGMKHAFRGGWKVMSRFGTLEPAAIAAADPDEFKRLCSETPPSIGFRAPWAAACKSWPRS